MKKILLLTFIIILIPFTIVNFFKVDQKEIEIKLNYESNTIIRVKRMASGKIVGVPFEQYIVGVLAGEMPIYFI